MMNTMIKKSPNLVSPIPRRNNEIRDEEIDNDDGIIYPPGYSVASPIPMNDPYSLPLAPAVLIEEHNTHSAEEGRLPTQNSEESHSKKTDSRFNPFRPVHPQCDHISYGCLTMVFIVFVGMAVLLKTYLPDILPTSNDESVIPSIDNEDIKSYDSYQPLSASPTVTRSNPPSMYPSHPPSTEPSPSPSFLPTVTRSNPPSMSLSPRSNPPSMSLSPRSNPPSMSDSPFMSTEPSPSPRYEEKKLEEKKLVAFDGSINNNFGRSFSMSGDLVVVGAYGVDNNEGAAYLFHLDGTELKKLTPGNDGEDNDWFGTSVSIDEKVVVGSWGEYVQVFSRQGIYERTIRCNDCTSFGIRVATLGNLIFMNGFQNSIYKLFVFSTEGELLKTLKQGSDFIYDVAISEKFIVTTAYDGKTIIYSNTSLELPKIAEINQGGTEVAVSNDRIVLGNGAYSFDGEAWLYKTDGTLVKTLDRQDASSDSSFGWSVAITDDKVIVGAPWDDDQGESSGSVFIYSAVTGEFLEKVVAPDGEANDYFGTCVCASDSYFVVGAVGVDSGTGAAYLFQSSE